MEGEQSTQHTEADENEGEENLLDVNGDVMLGGNLRDNHRVGSAIEVDTENTEDEQGRTSHEHQRQFHGRILLVARTPHADEQVHGNEGHLIEHEHGEHIHGDEEAEHTRGKQGEPKEILLRERLQLPGGKRSREYDDARKQQHHNGDSIHAHGIFDIQRLEPVYGIGEQHLGIVAGRTLLDEIDGKPDGQGKQTGRTRHHHATHLTEIACQPKAEQHQDGEYYE